MISFIAGLLVGGAVGMVVVALCAASAKDPAKAFTEEADPGIQVDYKRLYEKLMALPNCNDCADANGCPYRPEWGGTVRVNCPLHTTKVTAGVDFWRELLPDLRAAVGPAVYPFLFSGDMCEGTLNGDVLTMQAKNEFSYKMIANEKVFETLESVASAKARRPITVVLLHNGEDMNDD